VGDSNNKGHIYVRLYNQDGSFNISYDYTNTLYYEQTY
jgi:hypothetical protein